MAMNMHDYVPDGTQPPRGLHIFVQAPGFLGLVWAHVGEGNVSTLADKELKLTGQLNFEGGGLTLKGGILFHVKEASPDRSVDVEMIVADKWSYRRQSVPCIVWGRDKLEIDMSQTDHVKLNLERYGAFAQPYGIEVKVLDTNTNEEYTVHFDVS